MRCRTTPLTNSKKLFEKDKTSLGIVRPTKILDMEIRKANERMEAGMETAFFLKCGYSGHNKSHSPSFRIRFHYIFECEDSEKPSVCHVRRLGIGRSLSE